MKVVVLYRRQSETGRSVEEFIHEFKRRHPAASVEEQSLDTRDGAATASLYDVTAPPVILALRDDGSPLNVWQGDQLPLMNEVASYLQM